MRKHPKLLSKIASAAALLIAFNQEVGVAARDFQAGLYQSNPQQALQNVLYRATGITPSGTIDNGQLTVSIVSKAGGYAFGKFTKAIIRHFRM